MALLNTGLVALIVFASLGYTLATIGMKIGSASMTALALAMIVGGFALAVMAELVILRNADLAVVYITILAVETIIILAVSHAMGEGMNARQLAGTGLVFAGLMLVLR